MITRQEVIPNLLKACPTFQATWSQLLEDDSEIIELLYVSLGAFARHLLQLYKTGQCQEFHAISEAIESLHIDGDAFVKEAATIGLLEGIQNVWGNDGTDPELFVQYLLPESAKCWRSLNNFWDGRIGFVGEDL